MDRVHRIADAKRVSTKYASKSAYKACCDAQILLTFDSSEVKFASVSSRSSMVGILPDLKPRRVLYFQLLTRSTEMNASNRFRSSLRFRIGRLSLLVMSIAFLFGAIRLGRP